MSKPPVKPDEASSAALHAPLSPSSMYRSLNCLASLIPLEHPIPERPSPYAAEGDFFHELIARATETGMVPFTDNEEMDGHVEALLEHRNKIKDAIGSKAIFKELIEERVYFSDNIYGTLDYGLLYVKDGEKRLYVEDAKYGKGYAVPVIDPETQQLNHQIATYIAAARRTHDWPATRALAAIYQPRNYDHTDKALDQAVVEEPALKQYDKTLITLEKKALPILQGTAPKLPEPRTGPWCQFCRRIPVCPAYAKAASAEGIFDLLNAAPLLPMVPEVVTLPTVKLKQNRPKKPAELSDQEISTILETADIIRNYLKEVETYAAGRCLSDDPLPGWKVVAGRKQRKWPELPTDIAHVIEELRAHGLDATKVTLIGITQAERSLALTKGKTGAKKIIDSLTTYTEPKPKLVHETDPRPGLSESEKEKLLDSFAVIDEDGDVYS